MGVKLNAVPKMRAVIFISPKLSFALLIGATLLLAGSNVSAAVLSNSSDLSLTDTVINFDDPSFNFGSDIRDQYAPVGVVFGGPSYQGLNLINPNLVRYIPGASPPNALQVIPGGLAGATGLDIEFTNRVVELGFDYEVSNFANLNIAAYRSDGTLIESATFSSVSGFAGLREETEIARLDINSQDLRFSSPTFINIGIDNFEFTAATNAPEPSTFFPLTFVLIGSALVGKKRLRTPQLRRTLKDVAVRP